MAKLKIIRNEKGERSIFLNDKEMDDVVSATIYVSPGSIVTANIEVSVGEANIQD